MGTQKKGNVVIRSVLTGIGIGVLYFLIGTVLDYLVTQVLSQFVLLNCSEDCYFKYFNASFVFVVLVSLAGGVRNGVRTYKKLSEKP